MAEKFISERNLKFLLYEMLDAECLLQYPRFSDHSREVFDMVLGNGHENGQKPHETGFERDGPESA